MTKYAGVIVNINNKYVILNVKGMIKNTPLYSKLLPNDIINYEVDDNNQITIIEIVERKDQILFGIINNFKLGKADITFPNLPKFFSLQIENQSDFKLFSPIILNVSLNKVEVISVYDSITNRKNDKEIFLKLYQEQAKLCNLIPDYNKSECYYTEDWRDLTHLNTFNVDPTESKDFDDAISIDEIENKIYVHIVDANSQIELLSDNDINALKHSFTLYLPEHIQNILPQNLAENKLSLIKDEKRDVITVEFTINPETQDIVKHSIYKSVIKIKERYDYNEFNSILYEYPILYKFYEKWKKSTLNIPHLKLNINKTNGKIVNYIFQNNNDDAHKIIETLMILTNLTVSNHIGSLVPQRYHSKLKSVIDYNAYTGNEAIDSIISIKEFKPALYDNKNKGHFGLGLESYTHFTSPIRRYFDVVIHRLLSGIKYENIDEILNQVNNQERYIEKLVECYNNIKMLSYFEEKLHVIWNGYILYITDVGINVILENNLYELFIFNKNAKKFSKYQRVNVVIKSIDWLNLKVKGDLC